MTSDERVELTVTHRFTEPAERVFDAWLDPQIAGRWLFATPTGQMVRVEIDRRVGGAFAIVERRDGEDIEHVGNYLEIDPPSRLVFTFAVPRFSPLSTQVSIDIVPTGDGCELTLTHQGVLPQWADRTREGWSKLLAALAATIA
jgi:uncharacterized protein YndB with AHSA1/START domain